MDELSFAKYHGTGNDFVMIEDLGDQVALNPSLIAAVCHRGFGVGADGLIRVTKSAEADFFMDYHNADGSTAEMCGNGIRCLGKLVYERGLTHETELDVETRAGIKHLSLHTRGDEVETVTVDMGAPAFEKASIPMMGPAWEKFLQQPLEIEGVTFKASAVSMGNPHLVLVVEGEPVAVDVQRLGPQLEKHQLFPERTNVEFVVPDGDALAVRVWERGIGETMACGTGACAVVVAASEAGISARRADVRFHGGTLDVDWRSDGRVFLTGPAVRVFEGRLDPASMGERLES
ncbi:MAG: diaminopimelate epimerase [Actinomycetota bacterium]